MGLSFLNFFIVISSGEKMFGWHEETEEILEKYTASSVSPNDFEELEIERLKLRLLLKAIESSRTLTEAERRGLEAKQKIHELCYSFSYASLTDRKRRERKKIEKMQKLIQKLDTVTSKGEFYNQLIQKAKERISQYRRLESKPLVRRATIEQIITERIDTAISKTKKTIIKRAIQIPLDNGEEVRIILDKKHLTIISENNKLQFETQQARSEIENIFQVKNIFQTSLKNISVPIVIDARKEENKIKMDITEKIFEGNNIKTKNHSILLNT